jgi:hypothetical protein
MAEQQITPAPDAGKIPTPTFPTEPPKEIKEMSFSIDPKILGNVESGDSTITIDKKEIKTEQAEVKKEAEPILKAPKEEKKEVETNKEEPTKKVEEAKKTGIESVLKAPKEEVVVKKEEQKKEESIKAEKKSELITPVREHKGDQDAFDYSGFSPAEQTNLKNMSRQSREWAAGLIKETKSLAALKDATYLQHEAGYTLSPEFQQLQQSTYLAQTEAQGWERALLNIKSGKPFQDVTGFDKQGNIILGKEKPATDADEIRIANNLTLCTQAAQQRNGALQQFPQRFKQQIQADLQAVEQARKEKFAWCADPKLLEFTLDIDGTDKKVKDVKSDFKAILPIYWQNSPIAEVASDMFVAMVIQGIELKEARNGKQIAEIKKQEATRGEPSSDNVEQVVKKTEINGKPIPSTFSLEGAPFERR